MEKYNIEESDLNGSKEKANEAINLAMHMKIYNRVYESREERSKLKFFLDGKRSWIVELLEWLYISLFIQCPCVRFYNLIIRALVISQLLNACNVAKTSHIFGPKNSDIEARSISLLSALMIRSTRTEQTKARLNVIRTSDKYYDITPIGVKHYDVSILMYWTKLLHISTGCFEYISGIQKQYMSTSFIISWDPIQKWLPRKEESVMIILIPIGISYVVEL